MTSSIFFILHVVFDGLFEGSIVDSVLNDSNAIELVLL
jgi:hypothetical protein